MDEVVTRRKQPVVPLRGQLYAKLQHGRGRPVSRFLRQLGDREALRPAEFDRLRAERLHWMLDFACEHVPLYRAGPWRNALAGGHGALAAWPVLEPGVYRAHWSELLAQPQPRRTVMHRTTGSTGPATAVVWSLDAEAWWWAHRYRALEWHGVPIGAPSLRLMQRVRPLRDLLLGHACIPTLEAPSAIESAAAFLAKSQPSLITGTPSALFYLARSLRELGSRAPLVPIARAGGEQLFPFQRTAIESHLAARVVDSYGCTEIGALAGECPAGSMHVFADNVELEILRGDAPAGYGQSGDVVVTSLHNRAMPFVRYRVGDRAALQRERCRCGLPHPVITGLQARTAEVFLGADGVPHHGSELTLRMADFFADPAADAVRQFQFVQLDARNWQVQVETPGAQALHATANARLVGIVREVYGATCSVEVRPVGTIARERGKFRYYRVADPH